MTIVEIITATIGAFALVGAICLAAGVAIFLASLPFYFAAWAVRLAYYRARGDNRHIPFGG